MITARLFSSSTYVHTKGRARGAHALEEENSSPGMLLFFLVTILYLIKRSLCGLRDNRRDLIAPCRSFTTTNADVDYSSEELNEMNVSSGVRDQG